MARTLQFRRDTSAALDAITGAEGEIFVDLDTNTIRVHDGNTEGGVKLATESYVDNEVFDGDYNSLTNKPDLTVFDNVESYADLNAFPATGEENKVYIANDTGFIFRWSGSAYVQLTDQTAIWGNIGGTLSSQTDLQNALDAKLESGDIADFETTAELNTRDTANRDRTNHTGTQAISTVTNLQSALDDKQDDLVSGTNIKTINSESLLGSGNIDITSAEWGNITGTLSSQTDLQNALDAKLESGDIADFETTTELNARDTANRDRTNHTGTQAISTVDGLQSALNDKQDDLVSGTNIKTINGTTLLGSGDLEIGGGVEVSDTAPSSPSEGDLWWDSTSGTLKVYYDDGDSQQWVDASPTLSSDFTEDVYVPPPETLGQAYGGGIYMGAITAAGQCYALIVAPNATGCAQCQWKTTATLTAGTDSDVDGFANTYGPLDNADHPAGNWCATRTINGFSDWYLPAIDELETFYNNGATGSDESVIGSGEAFASVRYWSSTESISTAACILLFNFGIRTCNTSKTNLFGIRAVRREPI